MKLSIITVTYNSEETLRDTIESVISQDYKDIEYIIIDGASTDGTIEIVKSYGDKISKFLSEKDNGMYDAMNKGIKLATGEVVGLLHSDDLYVANNIISTVVKHLNTSNAGSVFADIVFVKGHSLEKVVRYYSSANFSPEKFAYGWMPAHPTFFVKREFYEKYGLFKTDYKISSDFELLVRFLAKYKISYCYIPKIFVKMRCGGLSTKSLKSNWIINSDMIRACRENGIQTNIFKVYSKYFTKVFQLIHRPRIDILL